MRAGTPGSINLNGKTIDYRVICSKSARKLRVRVGPGGVEVVHPQARQHEVADFLQANAGWILDQLRRVERLADLRRPYSRPAQSILLRGERTPVLVEVVPGRGGVNQVVARPGVLTVVHPARSRTPPARTLENWLRRQARAAIEGHLSAVLSKLKQSPNRVFLMGQRTKWGNCSALRNLSFNWRLVLAPDFVLRYLVTHEAVHLAVPDHSRGFWLTVQSLCPETERARQWLCANSHQLMVNLHELFASTLKE